MANVTVPPVPDDWCDNLVTTDVEAPPPRWHQTVTVRCGNLVSHTRHDLSRLFCPEHQPKANTEVRCHMCMVGGFTSETINDHYRIDCDGGEYD